MNKMSFALIFAIAILMALASCGLKENVISASISDALSAKIIRTVFQKEKNERYLNQVYIDSLLQKHPINKGFEDYEYLKGVSVLLNDGMDLDSRTNYFLEKIKANDFYKHSAYLKFISHHNLSLIYIEQEKYFLGLEEIMSAVAYLEENTQNYKSEIALCYQQIGYIASAYLGELEASTVAYKTALKLYEEEKDHLRMVHVSFNLGLQYFANDDFLLAKEFSKKAIQVITNHLPEKSDLNWSAIYPLYLNSHKYLNEFKEVKPIYKEAKLQYDKGGISLEDYNKFNLGVLEALLLAGMNREFDYQVNRLKVLYRPTCENKHSLSYIYRGVALHQKINGDEKERETQIKRMENVSCGKIVNYYEQEYVAALDRLIEIDKKDNNLEALKEWYEKKIDLSKTDETKKIAYLQQLDYWHERNLSHVEKNVSYQKEKLKASRIQMLFTAVFIVLLLFLLWRIWKLLKKVELKRAGLKEINSTLVVKNKELDESYSIQRTQKETLEEQYVKLEAANEVIKDKNIELLGDVRTQLLLLSNNGKVFKKLTEEIQENVRRQDVRSHLKDIIRSSQNEDIWKSIDQKFLLLNEDFFTVLSKQFPKLTNNDLKLCALVKMNLSSKEIARIQYMSMGSIKVAKSRLRKKLGLDASVNFATFLNGLD